MLQDPRRRRITLGVNPGFVERFITARDAEEAGSLGKRTFSNAAHLQKLATVLERAMLLTPLDDSTGDALIESGTRYQAAWRWPGSDRHPRS